MLRNLIMCVVVMVLGVAARPAAAATMVTFESCSTGAGSLCDILTLSATLDGSAIDVSVTAPSGYGIFGRSGANRAFGFNVAGSEDGLAISNLSPAFTFAGTDMNLGGGFGTFEYVINGPKKGSAATLPLSFTVTRADGFTTELELFELNAAGYLFASHLRNNGSGTTGFVAANQIAQAPEPATMLLFGSGLAAAALRRRYLRRMEKN